MDQREKLRQNCMETIEFREIICAAQADGFALDHLREISDIFIPFRFSKRNRGFGGGVRAAADHKRMDYGDQQQKNQQPDQAEQDVKQPHHVSLLLFSFGAAALSSPSFSAMTSVLTV